jgi:hypothetical protein
MKVRDEVYTNVNFSTKKALREAVAAGRKIGVFQPGPFGGNEPMSGTVYLEGPHYPEPHKWYATGTLEDGFLIAVK